MNQKEWRQLNRRLIQAGLVSRPQKLRANFRKARFRELQKFIRQPDGTFNHKYLNQVLQIIPIYESEIFKLTRFSQARRIQQLSVELNRFVYGALIYDHRSQAIQKYRRNRYGLNDQN